MKLIQALAKRIVPSGRVIVVLREEEIIIRRTWRAGTLKLFVERAEPDAEWALSRTRVTTHPKRPTSPSS